MRLTFERGTTLLTHDDEKVGTVDRVVLDTDTGDVTHMVVDAGALFAERRLVPLDEIRGRSDGDLVLRESCDPESLPHFEDDRFRTPDPGELVGLGSAMSFGGTGFAIVPIRSPEIDQEPVTPSKGPTEEIMIGDAVTAADGKSVGQVERIVADGERGDLEAIVAAKGLVFKRRRLIPAEWVTEIATGMVRLDRHHDAVLEQAPRP